MATKEENFPWVEKYRPKALDKVIGQKHIVPRLQTYLQKRSIPNMLFSGPPGVGKTVCAVALARELFGDTFSQDFLELNASDERGINVVRGVIKDFSRTIPLGADFKIIFLDEADALTTDAQQALRRTMEKYTGTVRFILSVNYASKIISPIQSRCALFKFKPLKKEDITQKINEIVLQEHLEIDKEAIESICDVCEGDLRSAINYLQAASATSPHIKKETIYEVASAVQPKEVISLIEACLNNDFDGAKKKLDSLFLDYGLSGEDIISQIYKRVIEFPDTELNIQKKIKIIDAIAEINFRLVEGANDRIQLQALLSQIILLNLN
ncbi:MAG TPA: replication factor C small subunit [archaeon]|jgi:replication factor C small subunit|nr:replication factor C small subunit [archaeon]